MYKVLFENKKAAFFDLDGTIYDSAPLWHAAFNNTMTALGLPGVSEATFHIDIDLRETIANIIKREKRELPKNPINKEKVDVEQIVQTINKLFLTILEEQTTKLDSPLTVRNGFWDLVYDWKEDKKLPIALVTNSSRNIVTETLRMLNVDESIFDLIITGDDVKKRKPHPQIYLKAAKALKIKPKNVIVFEDSVNGSEAALEADMEVILIWNGELATKEYSEKIKLRLPDFEGVVGKMDSTYMEYLNELADLVENEENTPTAY